jgi:poly(A) polymerase
VHTPTTDIDALCVVPRDIERDRDFFDVLPDILRATEGVEELVVVREAFVPCIKFVFNKVDIDLLFARIEYREVSNNIDLSHNSILRNCDSESIKSLNGRRVTEAILEHVSSNEHTAENFKKTLRCIKLWAKNRGIYSNVFGYCGGVMYAILVAYICKMNPKLEPCQLLDTFFKYYRAKDWKYSNPVHLGEIRNDPNSVGFPIDDKQLFYQPNERGDFFPIITPAFPAMNATYNVSMTTRNVMLTEMEKASMITD